MISLNDYIPIVGEPVVHDLKLLAEKLRGKKIQNINSTSVGGGVAEILDRMIPLLREIGVDAHWSVIKGGEAFFKVTKKFHNVLHGRLDQITPDDFKAFMETSNRHLTEMDLFGDIVFIHDPQPIALIRRKIDMPDTKWIWRCHIDVSDPETKVWNFLKVFINEYNASVFSAQSFSHDLPTRQFLVSPSIDPLSEKNCELDQGTCEEVLTRFGIKSDKPIITQISRFDYLKDPVGVIETYRMVKKYNDCQLILAGGTATDDPESNRVLNEVYRKKGDDPDIHILQLPPGSNIEINALQRSSSVVLQKSLKEGFGLTVAEALWKSKPVVASGVGGIPLQVKHKYSGLLCHSIEGAAFAVKQLLNSPEYAKKLGENGKEHIKQNFLLTRHLQKYLLLFLAMYHKEDIINL